MQLTGFRLGRILAPIRPVAFLLGLALSLLAIVSNFLTAQNVLRQPEQVLPDATRRTLAQLRSALAGMGLPAGFFGLFALGLGLLFSLVFLISGWLILWRKSRDWYGLYLGLILIGWSTGLGITSEMPPLPAWIAKFQSNLSWLLWPGFFLQLYYFPNGRVTPRWARWFAGMVWGLSLYGLAVEFLQVQLTSFVFALAFIIPALLVGGYAQITRYRHAGPIERQQVKWVMLALLVWLGFFLGAALLINFTGIANPAVAGPSRALLFHLVFTTAYLLSFIGLPISIVVAILRYRLFDIDVIIRKTLVWGALSVLLGLVYFGGVTLLQSVFTAVSGSLNFDQAQSPLSIVISTLVIAALFNPLRRRVQDFVDRRFYRRKYNAEQALASFATLARQEVDPEEIGERFLGVVEETVQPESASLWLRKTAGNAPLPAPQGYAQPAELGSKPVAGGTGR